MSNLIGKAGLWKSRESVDWIPTQGWNYPTGMVWCPMKMSGMANLKCAELQKELGCGSLKEFKIIAAAKPGKTPIAWPWLRRGRPCPERAPDQDVRQLRLALSPLKSVEKSRKNPRAYRCPACGGDKAFGARQCRRCWSSSPKKSRGSFGF